MSRTYDGLLRPEADKDPTRQLQFFIDKAAKSLGFNIFQMIEAALAAVKELIYEIVEAIIGYATNPETLLADIGTWTNQIPLVDELWDIIAPIIGPIFLGVAGTAGPELAAFFENIRSFFSVVDFLVSTGDFDAEDAIIAFVQLSLIPTNLLARLVGGYVPGLNIPLLDASKIGSGQLQPEQMQLLINAISQAFGGSAGVDLPGLNNVLGAIPLPNIADLPNVLSAFFSPFNPPNVIGTGQVTGTIQNLLHDAFFLSPDSLLNELIWVWDAATPAGTPGGSAKVNAATNSNVKSLKSKPIQVAPGDTINASVFAQWASLIFTGSPISLALNLYDATDTIITQIPLASAVMTGATSSWVQLIGTHIVTEPTAVWGRLAYLVNNTATAGSTWFTNGSITKPNLLVPSHIESLPDLFEQTQATIDTAVQAIINGPGTLIDQSQAVFKAQMSQMARFLGYVTSGAAPAGSVAQIASNVDNAVKARAVQKAFNDNIDPTTDATFKLKDVWQNATLPTVACTAGATTIGDITIRDGGNKNAVTWYGYPTGGTFGSITSFKVNIWSVNKTTNVRTLVHGSANLIGTIGTGSAPVFNSYNLPASIVNAPGDRLTVEIAILGAGTYNLVGQTISAQIPFHSVYGLHGLTRASAAAPTTVNPPGVGGSTLSYSRAIPWIGLSGVQSATQYSPVIIPYYSSGSFNPALYQWANYGDFLVCGPGGNGASGSGYWGGFAGHQGAWGGVTLAKSVWGAVTSTINITAGGSQTASGITIPGWGTLYGGAGANEGGVSGTNNMGQYPAPGPGDYAFAGENYPGGAGGQSPQAGGAQPGGAGAGGNAPFTVGQYIYGGPGGPGIGYIKLYQ